MDLLLGFVAGALIATVTVPVGVSGAVFLLPVQLSVLHVANPAVTPTNLLYNVVAGPGALVRYLRTGRVSRPLVLTLVSGTVPGVVIGAAVRVFLIPGPRAFRVVAGVVLLLLGAWLTTRTLRGARPGRPLRDGTILALAFAIGVVGGVYGIGGGSFLSPILVGSGLAVGVVAPAAMTSTFVTSIVGALTYLVLSTVADGPVAPDWPVGIACGLGGLLGGYVGARLQPHLPERALKLLLGVLAVGVGLTYVGQGVL